MEYPVESGEKGMPTTYGLCDLTLLAISLHRSSMEYPVESGEKGMPIIYGLYGLTLLAISLSMWLSMSPCSSCCAAIVSQPAPSTVSRSTQDENSSRAPFFALVTPRQASERIVTRTMMMNIITSQVSNILWASANARKHACLLSFS
jgi:hypothetical protein